MRYLNRFFKAFELSGPHRYTNLEGVRALAVLMVFNVHFFTPFKEEGYLVESGFLRGLFQTLNAGHSGVDLFFVLSGFLIFRSLGKSKSLTEFMFRRYHRLWPVVFVTTLPELFDRSWLIAFDNLTLLKLQGGEYINFVNWSLTYEIYFYFFIGLWFFFLQKFRVFQENGVFTYSLMLLGVFSFTSGHFISEPYRFCGFLWGVFLAKLLESGRLEKGLGFAMSKYGWVVTLVMLPVLMRWWQNSAPFFLGSQILYFLLVASLLRKDSPLTPVFSSRPARFLGAISYSFYVLHYLWGLRPASWLLRDVPDSLVKMAALGGLSMSVSIVLASILFLWLEKPYFTGEPYFPFNWGRLDTSFQKESVRISEVEFGGFAGIHRNRLITLDYSTPASPF